MQEQTTMVKKSRKNLFIISLGVIVLLIASFITYKTVLTNPLNIDQDFYRKQFYIYETTMNAYDEERPLTEIEESKIEDILNDKRPNSDNIGKMSEKEFEEYQIVGYLEIDVEDMYIEYHYAMEYEGNERKSRLMKFNEAQKVAKAALGLK